MTVYESGWLLDWEWIARRARAAIIWGPHNEAWRRGEDPVDTRSDAAFIDACIRGQAAYERILSLVGEA